jgi:hypothetical protein
MSFLDVVDIPKSELYKELINDASYYANINGDKKLTWAENYLTQLDRCGMKIVLNCSREDIRSYPDSGPQHPPRCLPVDPILWPRNSFIVWK